MSKPLLGLTFCCTGLEPVQRQTLEDQIRLLGGLFNLNLTSQVQFLVVTKRDTDKYIFLVRYRHDITFIAPSVIENLYQRWKAGEDIVFTSTLLPLPVFAGFNICVARIDKPSDEIRNKLMSERFRKPPEKAAPRIMPKDPFLTEEIMSILEKLGAAVSKTLTPQCSLLVASSASGRRYTMAKQWNTPVVHPIWVLDSCLREAALHLDDYELSTEFNSYNSTSFVWKKLFLSRIAHVNSSLKSSRREITPQHKKTEIWTSIMDSAHPLLTKEATTDTWDEHAPSDTESKDPEDTLHVLGQNPQPLPAASTLFIEHHFLPLGLTIPEQKVLRSVVESHQGSIVSFSDDPKITHVVMLVKNGPQTHLMLLMLPSTIKRRISDKSISLVTNWFIERSIFYGKLRADPWSRPMIGMVPLKVKHKVCITGFTGVELLHLEKLISYLHLEFCETLNSSRDLLIVNINLFKSSLSKTSPKLFEYEPREILDCPVYANGTNSKSIAVLSTRNKMAAARKWSIPIVSLAFLWEMINILEKQPTLMTPEVANPNWCVFAPPKDCKNSSFMNGAASMSHNAMASEVLVPPTNDTSVRLPSPKKVKDKERYGRLVGRGESLLKKLEAAKESADANREPPSEGPSSQDTSMIGYGNDEKAEQHKLLMEKLEGSSTRPTKRPRRATRGCS